MNYSAADQRREGSEFELAGLTMEPADLVDAPRVKESPVTFECRYVTTAACPQTVLPGEYNSNVVVGEVLAVRIKNEVITKGRVDVAKVRPIARLGYTQEYTVCSEVVHDIHALG